MYKRQVVKRMADIERVIEKGGVPSSGVVNNAPVQAQEEEPEKEVVITKAIPEDIKEVISTWKKFVSSLNTGIVKESVSPLTTRTYGWA